MRELIYYVACSMDGFIAGPSGDFEAFPQNPRTLAALFERYPETCPTHARAPLGIDSPPRRFDTVVMGYRTYEPALAVGLPGGAYSHLRQVVVTHRELPVGEQLTTVSGDVAPVIEQLKAEEGMGIWLCGGANLAAQLIDHIDEIQLKVNPVALGAGIPLLPFAGEPRSFELTASEVLPGGVCLQTYRPQRR